MSSSKVIYLAWFTSIFLIVWNTIESNTSVVKMDINLTMGVLNPLSKGFTTFEISNIQTSNFKFTLGSWIFSFKLLLSCISQFSISTCHNDMRYLCLLAKKLDNTIANSFIAASNHNLSLYAFHVCKRYLLF